MEMRVSETHTTDDSLCSTQCATCTNLVNTDRLSPKLDLIHNLTSVLSILFRQEFTETIALVSHRNTVLWKVNVHWVVVSVMESIVMVQPLTYWARLQHEFPYERVRTPLIEVSLKVTFA